MGALALVAGVGRSRPTLALGGLWALALLAFPFGAFESRHLVELLGFRREHDDA